MFFGTTKANVKSNETRTLVYETITGLIYEDINLAVRNILYLFESGKLTSSVVYLANTTYNINEVVIFLFERYQYVGETSGMYIFINRKTNDVIGLTDDDYGLQVIYIPPTGSSSNILLNKIKDINYFNVENGLNVELSSELRKNINQKIRLAK